MIEWMILKRLVEAFPGGYADKHGEFIVSKRWHQHIRIANCSEQDVKRRMLETFSRAAAKSRPYRTDVANRKYNDYMRNGINRFLGTQFSRGDMMTILECIGDGCNPALTVQFIEAGYDMELLKSGGRLKQQNPTSCIEDVDGFPQRMKDARKHMGLSQADFAKVAGLCSDSIRLYETGRRMPNRSTLNILAAAFGCTEEWLSSGEAGEG